MTDLNKTAKTYWEDAINVVLGLWLIVSPWVLSFNGLSAAFWTTIVLGLVIALVAFGSILKFHEWGDVADMVLGVVLIVSPWAFGFATLSAVATWNAVIIGVAVIALSGWSVYSHRQQTA